MASQDDDLLRQLGYEQKMGRSFSVLQNFGASFSIISIVTGITTLFGFGLSTGGPAVMSIGWIVVCSITMFVAISMAQIVSAVPTSGGPYYWSAALAPREHAPFLAWVTGWFNFLGQVGVTTGITFGCAGLITTLATLDNDAYVPTPAQTVGVYAALLVSHCLINVFLVKTLKWLNNLSILLHSVGVACIAISILALAPTHQSAKFVFATFNDATAAAGTDVSWGMRASPAYVAIVGILMAQYTITGYDASAHLAEETTNAAIAAPIGVITSVGCSAIFGLFYILALLFSIQDFDRVATPDVGQPVLQIFVDVAGITGGRALMSVVIVCIWHCGLFSLTSNSRMAFAFARDGGLPKFFDHVNPRLQVPVRTICLMAFLSFCLGLPSLGSTVAFSAATSIATVGLYISYGLPILIGMIYEKDFKKGPFNLRGFSRPIALVAVLWICFITVVFCLPTVNPVDSQTLNYTPVCVGIVAFGALSSWIWARKWFVGPLAAMEEAMRQVGATGGNVDVVNDLKEHKRSDGEVKTEVKGA